MEIGLDYMHMRTRAQHYALRWTGIALLLAGIGLVIAGGIYYGYIFSLRADLNDYVAQRQGLEIIQASGDAGGATVAPLFLPAGGSVDGIEELGFIPVSSDAASAPGTQPPAAWVTIPTLGIDRRLDSSSVSGLSIVDYASGVDPSRQSEVSVNPGEKGPLWLFGPAGNAVNGFGGLTDAPGMLAKGNDILITVGNGSQEYLYLGTHTSVIKSATMQLSSTDLATIHLVAPVPPGLYDHFLILSGELVGMR